MAEKNILVTVDENYVPQMNVMLCSLKNSDKNCFFNVFVMNRNLGDEKLDGARKILGKSGKVISVKTEDSSLSGAPISDRYPKEMYYRIFAAKYLPENVDRILYLDPDLIVRKNLDELYDIDLDGYYYAAATHIRKFIHKINEKRLDLAPQSPYINSGVMMINLALLRKEQDFKTVFDYIEGHKKKLLLPDQDVLSAVYGEKIKPIDSFRFNMTERLYFLYRAGKEKINLDYVEKNSAIIHYCGKNKPWKDDYRGKLKKYYTAALEQTRAILSGETEA